MTKMLNQNERWQCLAAVRKTFRCMIAACICWLLLPAMVQGQFIYATNNGTITVTGYTGTGGATIIPATVNGLWVTAIADGAFDGSSISSVSISSNITSIADDAFLDCTSLTNVVVDAQNTNYNSSNGVLFNHGLGTLVLYPAGLAGSAYGIPTSVTNLGYFAFSYCPSLSSVTISNGVSGIGNFVFFSCIKLASVTISATVTNIGSSAFYNCLELTNLTVNALNPTYGSTNGVLFNHPLTTLILYPPGIVNGSYAVPDGVTNIGNYAFQDCDNLTNVTLSPELASIGQQTFSGSTNLTGITIPGSVVSIGSDAFDNCTRLASLILSNGVASIGQQAFGNCTSLTNVIIPQSLTNIGDTAFEYCTSLTNITVDPANTAYSSLNGVLFNYPQTRLIQYPAGQTRTSYAIPGSVTDIGDYAFYYSDLSEATIPDTVTNIEPGAFEYDTNLAGITIPASVTAIGAFAFFNCSSLGNLIISNGVTTIGANAFGLCASLTSITIPASVTAIGDYAFQSCGALTNAYFEGNAVYDDGTIFSSDSGTVYYLPGTTGWGATFGGLPTAELSSGPPPPIFLNSPGLHGNQFGFTISWATNLPAIVEACTNLENPVWLPIQTNSITGGTFDFTDPAWTNFPTRYYRVSSQ